MAFTAKIQSISLQNDEFIIGVTFNDSASGWESNKLYHMSIDTTQAQAVAAITADGALFKAALSKNTALQSKIGTIITI